MSSQFSRVKEIPGSVWLLSTLLVILIFYVGIRTGGFNMNLERIPWGILVPCAAAFAFGHSYLLLGWQRAVTLFLMATVISFCFEYVGESTGLIFGPYEYTHVLGWKLFERIPFLIPLAWYMMFYPSYLIANLLAEGGPISHRTKLVPIIWLSILSAMVMTAWDLTMDPVMSYNPCDTGKIDCLKMSSNPTSSAGQQSTRQTHQNSLLHKSGVELAHALEHLVGRGLAGRDARFGGYSQGVDERLRVGFADVNK